MPDHKLPNIEEIERVLRKLAQAKRGAAEIIKFPKKHRKEYEKTHPGIKPMWRFPQTWGGYVQGNDTNIAPQEPAVEGFTQSLVEQQFYTALSECFREEGILPRVAARKRIYAEAKHEVFYVSKVAPLNFTDDFDRAMARLESDVQEGRWKL